jgi:hypothetical protein
MDEELKQRVLSYMDATERVVSSEMPLVAQEYLNFQLYSSLAGCVLCVVLVASFGAFVAKLAWFSEWSGEPRVLFGILAFAFTALSFAFLCVNVYEAARVSIAPRVVLLEKAADLIGGGK